MNHHITVTKDHTSTHNVVTIVCSCGQPLGTFNAFSDFELDQGTRAISDHKINVLAELAGVEFSQSEIDYNG